jgi:hypothetical protein
MTKPAPMTKPAEATPTYSRPEARAKLPRGTIARRLIASSALGLAALMATGGAQARAPGPRPAVRPIGGVSVDVRPLLEQGLGGFAETLRAELTSDLQAEFGASLRPGERIVVLLRSLSLATYVGDINVFQLSDNDYLDGVVTLVGPNGQELATKDILAVSLASSGGAWYIQGGEQRRTAVLARTFASWARRYIPS